MAVIDIGPGAINRTSNQAGPQAFILKDNPADGDGSLNSMEFWFVSSTTDLKCGTFYGVTTTWTNRDYELIGAVTSGSKQTFTGLACEVESDDLLGAKWASYTDMEKSTTGGGGYWSNSDPFGAGAITYGSIDNIAMSIYATGTTPAASVTPSNMLNKFSFHGLM